MLLSMTFLSAKIKHYTREYTYQASDYDSKVSARSNALEQVKVLLLEEVARYIQANQKLVRNDGSEVYTEDITSYVAGVTETVILDESWNGTVYWIKADIALDPDDVSDKLDEVINNKELSTRLKSERARTDSILAENIKLREQLKTVSNQKEKIRIVEVYTEGNKTLRASEWFDKGLSSTDSNEKISFYSKALEMDPKFAFAYHNRGVAYDEQRNYSAAIRDYSKAITIDPNYASTYNNRGIAYRKQGDLSSAIADYTKAISIDPDYSSAYNNRGIAYRRKGNYDKAIRDYTMAIAIDPKYSSAYNNRGLAFRKKGDLASAILDYNRSIAINPDYASVYISRGNAYKKQGDLTLALNDYNKALEIDPQFASAYHNRGIIYDLKGKLTAAMNDFNKAISISAKNASVFISRGNVYKKQGKLTAAIEDYTKAVKINPAYGAAYNNRGIAFYNQGDFPSAIQDYSKAIELNSRIASRFNNRGNAYKKNGDLSSALKDYQKTVNVDPKYADAYNSYSLLVYENSLKEQFPKAVEMLNSAINLRNNVNYYNTRGRLLFEMGQNSRSIEDLNHFISNCYDSSKQKKVVENIEMIKKMGGKPAEPKIQLQ